MTSILKDTDNSGSSIIHPSRDVQNTQSFTDYTSRIWLLCSDYSCKSPQTKVRFVENERSPPSFGQFINQRMLFSSETHLLHLPQVLLSSMTITPASQGTDCSHSIYESWWKEMSRIHYNCQILYLNQSKSLVTKKCCYWDNQKDDAWDCRVLQHFAACK